MILTDLIDMGSRLEKQNGKKSLSPTPLPRKGALKSRL
jgi:hypothetical protein